MKHTLVTRAVALVLSSLLICTTGCARQGETLAAHPNKEISAPSLEQNSGDVKAGESSATSLTKNILPLPNSNDRLFSSALAGQTIFLCGIDVTGAYNFCRLNISDNSISTMNITYDKPIISFSASEYGTVYLLRVDEDGRHIITRLSADGGADDIEVAPEVTRDNSIISFSVLNGGFLVDNYSEVIALDSSGAVIKSFGKYTYGAQIVRLSEDKAFVIYTGSLNANGATLGEAPTHICNIDGNFNELGNAELTGGYTSFFAGVYDTLNTSLAKTIYEYQYSSGTVKEIINISASNIDIPECYMGNGSFFLIEFGKPVIYTLSVDNSVKVLSLYTYNASRMLTTAIQCFNETNRGYFINIKDYAKYDDLGSSNVGLGRYAAEVIAGEAPDIYDLGAFSQKQYAVKDTIADQYAAKGLLEDLSGYFEEDSSYSLSSLFEPVLEHSIFKMVFMILCPHSLCLPCAHPDPLYQTASR